MGSSSSTPASSTAIKKQSSQERQQVLYVEIKKGNNQNFYELFGFERYSDPSPAAVKKAFRHLSAMYHPDKNPDDLKLECESIMCVLGLARDTLTDSKKKYRYDLALRKELNEEDGWNTFRFLSKAFTCVGCILGGGAAIIAGICTGGLAVGIVGSAALSAGISGSLATYSDPDQPINEFALDIGVGAVQGAVCGAIGAAAAPAVSASTTLAGKVGTMALSGAGCGVSFMAVKDGTDLARGKKSTEEIFSLANAQSYVGNALIGAALGGAIGAFAHGASSAATVTDDASIWLTKLGKRGLTALKDIASYYKLSPGQVMKAIEAGRAATGLSALAILAGHAGSREEDRFTTLPTACDKRAPNYLELACGRCTKIEAAPMKDLAFPKKVVTPLPTSQCLQAYTEETPLYRNANSALRSDQGLEDYAAFIWHAKLGIKELVKERGVHTGIVWRSCNLKQEHLDFYIAGRQFLWASFVSTSKKEEQARKFKGNALFKINCAGKGLTYCVDVSHISSFPEEEEVLFFPYSGFIVDSVTTEDSRIVVSLKAHDTFLVEANY